MEGLDRGRGVWSCRGMPGLRCPAGGGIRDAAHDTARLQENPCYKLSAQATRCSLTCQPLPEVCCSIIWSACQSGLQEVQYSPAHALGRAQPSTSTHTCSYPINARFLKQLATFTSGPLEPTDAPRGRTMWCMRTSRCGRTWRTAPGCAAGCTRPPGPRGRWWMRSSSCSTCATCSTPWWGPWSIGGSGAGPPQPGRLI